MDSRISDGRDSDFHDQDSSLDHGRTVMTASEGLEGLPMVTLTPPASPDQPMSSQEYDHDQVTNLDHGSQNHDHQIKGNLPDHHQMFL